MFQNLRTNFIRNPFIIHLNFRKSIQTKSIASLLDCTNHDNLSPTDKEASKIRVVGWVKNFRDQKQIKFVNLTDGSDSRHLQLVIMTEHLQQSNKEKNFDKILSSMHFNTSIEAIGNLVKSENKKQNVEFHVSDLSVIGECEPAANYPFQFKKSYTFEHIRPFAHMRSHVNLFASVLRFRSELTQAFHDFFYKNKFIQIHTPIITLNNCEGGCETFQVNINEKDKSLVNHAENFNKILQTENLSEPHVVADVKQFFLKPAYLTASAQLHLETLTTTLGNVYTLSPTFRAEKSLTRHHLAEFYMLEAELIDMNNLNQLLDFVESLVREVSLNVYERFSKHDLDLILSSSNVDPKSKHIKTNHLEEIINSVKKNFERITYVDALKILNESISKNKKKKLAKKEIVYGEDLNKEQEKLLVEYFNNSFVFVTNYPRSIKPFYMRRNDLNEDLVDNFDLLAPNVGEIVGGSNREHRLSILEESIAKQNLDINLFKHYIETKKFGAMKMGGFGLGLERFIQFLINIENIRDTSAYPRYLYNCKM